jgi:hypothetical protein
LKGFPVVRVSVQVSCTPIERTLHEHIAFCCADEVSQHESRDTAWTRVKGMSAVVRSARYRAPSISFR